MKTDSVCRSHDSLRDALEAMEAALALLDAAAAPQHIGAHLDLAISLLRDVLPPEPSAAPVQPVQQPPVPD